VGLQVHTLQLVWVLVLWMALHEGVYLLLGMLRRQSLVCWSIGPLGAATTYLRAPGRLFVLLQVVLPAMLAAGFLRFSLFETTPPPIVNLPTRTLVQVLVILLSLLFTSTIRVIMLVRDWRYPLWGEARVLRSVSWCRATGACIYFTTFGRSFLRERFQSSPREFLQTL
jgi:hypothetical protein